MNKIKLAIVGTGNRVSSLIQGIHYYRDKKPEDAIGLVHWEIGGYGPGDIEVVAAFDINKRIMGSNVNEAIFSRYHCTTAYGNYLTDAGVTTRHMSKISDGDPDLMKGCAGKTTFLFADYAKSTREEVVSILKETGVEVIINCLPAGSEEASRFYAYCALDAGVSFVNNSPVLIASNSLWALKFEYHNIPLIGDDIKSLYSVAGFREVLLRKELSQEDIKSFYSIAGFTTAIDSIRCAKLALDRGLGGVLLAPSAYFCKRTLHPLTYDETLNKIKHFINEPKGAGKHEIPVLNEMCAER